MSDVLRVFYVHEIGEEGCMLYDAVDATDAHRQHCAGDNGAEPDADRGEFVIGPMDADMIEAIRTALAVLREAALGVVSAWMAQGGATSGGDVDRALEALQEVLNG